MRSTKKEKRTLEYDVPVLKQRRPLLGCFWRKASRIPRHGLPSVIRIDLLRSSDARERIRVEPVSGRRATGKCEVF
jgi:hypothetical protein